MVFTQYDLLYDKVEYDYDEEIEDMDDHESRVFLEGKTREAFEQSCITPLRKLNPRLECATVSRESTSFPSL